MAITYALDRRCTDILKMVVYAGGYVSVSTITDQLGISKRSAYYDIEKICDWLRENGLPELERDRRKGIRVSEEEAAPSVLLSAGGLSSACWSFMRNRSTWRLLWISAM